MRNRISRRRRTVSDSPDVIARLDDFICLIPEIGDRPQHIQRTRNVLNWLAQIDFDAETSMSLFDEDPLDDIEAPGRRAQNYSLESIVSGSGSNCGCVHYSRDNWCQECLSSTDCVTGGRRSGRRSDSTEMEIQQEDLNQGLSALYPDGVKAELQQGTSADSGISGAVSRQGKHNYSGVQIPILDGTEEFGSEVAKVKVPDEELETSKKPVFYFEEDNFDDESEKGVALQPVHFESPSEQNHLPDTLLKQREHRLGSTESSTIDGPQRGGGYDWLRMRILGADRKRRISTGSGLSAKFLASRGLLRNHHSFTSAISGASSEYTYRESLVSKGFSIDCGEDLNDFVIQGEDLLEAAEFSRYTLTNIDQLHQELEVIQRNITYINDKVEFLQSRDDLPSFAARYGYGLEESIGNDPFIMEAATFESGMRRQRSRSLSLTPGDANDVQITTCREIEDVHPAMGDGFVWDYGSDLALNPVYSHHRSLSGLAEDGEENVSNQLRTRRSRSDEMEFTFRRDLSSDDLPRMRSDDVVEDDPEMTYLAQLPVRQHNESICDEYFDDDYDMLTHLHR